MNGWYNNTLKNVISNLVNSKLDIDWQNTNRLQGASQNMQIVYGGHSVISSVNFPAVVKYANTLNIQTAYPFSSNSEVSDAIAYNNSRVDSSEKIKAMVTEYEPYNPPSNYSGMTALYTTNAPLIKSAGMKLITYMGWPADYYWMTICKFSDEINLHCYIPSANMTPTGIWNYVKGRLASIALACGNLCKKIVVNIIFSCEPSFAYNYFLTHTWDSAYTSFLTAWNANKTPQMQNWITIGGEVMFVTEYGKQIKP